MSVNSHPSGSPDTTVTRMSSGGSDRRSERSLAESEASSKPQLREGPSSRSTVLTIAGLFIVGLTCVSTGVIVLATESHSAFLVAGSIFLAIGIAFLVVCGILQKKNLVKYVHGLEQDLYFMNISSNPVWKMLFVDDDATTNNVAQSRRV